jgi:chaperone BCS1
VSDRILSYDSRTSHSLDGRQRAVGFREVNQSDETGFPEDKTVVHSGVSLSALLNCLDGVGAQEGRILIMTTNHPDKLDAALTRPSRVDKSFFFGYADKSSIGSIFSLIYKPFIEL